jgi:hypothetical protein
VTRAAVAAIVVCLGVLVGSPLDAKADDADQVFQGALARGDVAKLEELGASRPLTRWTDDAWVEAARLAIRGKDFTRARRDLEAAVAIAPELERLGIGDAALAGRARRELAGLAGVAGTTGQWDAVAAEHERLVAALRAPGDPHGRLAALEQLARAHPGYPRAASLMVSLGNAWEREGEGDRAIAWLRDAVSAPATPADHLRAHSDLVRVLIRTGELSHASGELAKLSQIASSSLVGSLRDSLRRAQVRRAVRWIMRSALVLLGLLALFTLRRASGSWRGVLTRLVRPPSEALFILPLALLLIVVAYTGNPFVARAVRTIVLAGVAASWISGAILDGRDHVGLRRALSHAVLAIVAIAAATYLAVDDGHLINFVIDTWRGGPEIR